MSLHLVHNTRPGLGKGKTMQTTDASLQNSTLGTWEGRTSLVCQK